MPKLFPYSFWTNRDHYPDHFIALIAGLHRDLYQRDTLCNGQGRVFGRWQLQESGHRVAAFLHDALPRPAARFACTNGTLTAPPFKRKVPLNVVSNRPQFSWRMLPTSGCSSPRAQLKSHEQHDATYLAGVCSLE
ncbi:MAG: hypothetical protein WBZ01_14670 [Terriglobales bacterium]